MSTARCKHIHIYICIYNDKINSFVRSVRAFCMLVHLVVSCKTTTWKGQILHSYVLWRQLRFVTFCDELTSVHEVFSRRASAVNSSFILGQAALLWINWKVEILAKRSLLLLRFFRLSSRCNCRFRWLNSLLSIISEMEFWITIVMKSNTIYPSGRRGHMKRLIKETLLEWYITYLSCSPRKASEKKLITLRKDFRITHDDYIFPKIGKLIIQNSPVTSKTFTKL